jgi:hypothetical protein
MKIDPPKAEWMSLRFVIFTSIRPLTAFSDNMLSENEGFRFQELTTRLPDTRNLTLDA